VAARLHHPRIADPAHRTGILSLLYLARALIPYEYATRLDHGGASGLLSWLQHLRNVAGDLPATLAFAWHLLRDRALAERKFPSLIVTPRNRCYSLDLHAEQQPNPASRVTLGPGRDALGQPRLHIDWRYARRDVDAVQRALALLAGDFERSGVGRLDYNPQAVEMEMTRYGAYGGHHIGTARMGSDVRSSVTDGDGRVHGVANLFVAGAALFPTSGQANPTLTIVALALRQAALLKRLQAGEALAAPRFESTVVPMRLRQTA
jgi:choline dehydrogenase-like flavoprotein